MPRTFNQARSAIRVVSLVLLLSANSTSARGAIHETTVPPRPADKFKSAAYTLYVPDGVRHVRAVILHQHGCGRNGITCPRDLQWQALARKHDAALMGSHLVPNGKCDDWCDPANGSDDAFHAALAALAEQSKHPELVRVPWALWGHSGGAHWASQMAARHPDRVVAVFARSGGKAVDPLPAGVPVMFQFGVRERTDRFAKLFDESWRLFEAGRARGAPWSFAVDPKSSHDTRDSRLIAIPFFDGWLTARLPEGAPADDDGPVNLKPVDAAKGWLADPATPAAAPAAEFTGDRSKASWLPDEAAAEAWAEFNATGSVTDTTPPPAPTDVRAAAAENGTVVVTWSADADVESGIKRFRIFRDGREVGVVAGSGRPKDPPSFQWGNYGDEPAPVDPVMRFVDERPGAGGGAAAYEVSALNHSDKESERSRPALPK